MERQSMYEDSRHQHMQRCDEWVLVDVAIDGDDNNVAVSSGDGDGGIQYTVGYKQAHAGRTFEKCNSTTVTVHTYNLPVSGTVGIKIVVVSLTTCA
jgi:hypothetical protein